MTLQDSENIGAPVAPTATDRHRAVVAELTGPGGPHEVVEIAAADGGSPIRVYRGAADTLGQVFADLCERHADRTLTVGVGGDHTYAAVAEQGRRLAWALRELHGIRPGDRVGIMMANRSDHLVALFAICWADATAVLLNARASVDETRDALADVPCRLVIADARRVAVVQAASSTALVCVDPAADPPPGTAAPTDLRALLDACPHQVAQIPVVSTAGPDDPCLVLFTSGTSGRAKGVALSHRSMVTVGENLRLATEVNLRLASQSYGIAVDDLRSMMPTVSALLVFPLFHVSGLAALTTSMLAGGAVATMPRWSATDAARLISDHRLSLLAGPPMVVDDLLATQDPALLGSLVNVVPGGQATTDRTRRRIEAALPTAQRSAGWGMTETGGSVCTANGAILAESPTTSGPMNPTMDVRVTVDGVVAGPGEPGELEVRGPQVMLGYVGRPDDTAAAVVDGWLRTGDIGLVDDAGLVHIVDRLKDIVISAGENISCAEVENAIATSDRVGEVAAFGVADDRRGERLVVVVTPAPGARIDAGDIVAIARETLPGYKIPTEVIVDDEPLPRTATGKVRTRDVRERHGM